MKQMNLLDTEEIEMLHMKIIQNVCNQIYWKYHYNKYSRDDKKIVKVNLYLL